jgi:hypothetical protein
MRMQRTTLAIVSLTSILGVFGGTREARAQDAPAEATDCAAAYEAAQTERQLGHLKAAAHQAMSCSRATCNQTLVQECIALFEGIQAEMPSMVFSARRADGGDLVSVRVEMDGQPLLDHLEGKAVSLDPGAHEFKFIAEGFEPKTIAATARVGDRNRLVEVVFGEVPVAAPAAPPPPALDPGPPPAAKVDRGAPVATYVLVGVSAVALGTFGYFKLTALNDYSALKDDCSPACNPEDVDDVRAKDNLSWIALGVSAAAATAATILYFATDDSETASQMGFGPTPGGAAAHFRARF